VPANLAVPLHCRGALHQICSFQDRIFPVLFLDIQHGLLQPALLLPLRTFRLLLLLPCIIVRKQIKLLKNRLLNNRSFIHNMIRTQGNPSDQKFFVNNSVI